MEPPVYSGAPKKKANVGLIIGIVVAALCFCCVLPVALLVKGGMSVVQGAGGMIGCGTEMSDLRNGVVAYAKAHDGKLPAADHWQDDIQSFVKPTQVPPPFKAVSPSGDVCDAEAPSSVSYNTDVAGKKLTDLEEKDDTVILFESTGKGKNKSGKYAARPFDESPKIIGAAPRGWITISLHGEAVSTNKAGMQQPVQVGKGFKSGS